MSRRTNFTRKNKAAKRQRQRDEKQQRFDKLRAEYNEAQRNSGMPPDVFALHVALGGS